VQSWQETFAASNVLGKESDFIFFSFYWMMQNQAAISLN